MQFSFTRPVGTVVGGGGGGGGGYEMVQSPTFFSPVFISGKKIKLFPTLMFKNIVKNVWNISTCTTPLY